MGIQNIPNYLSFFIPILKSTTKISPVRDDSFQAGGDHLPINCRSFGADLSILFLT